MRCRCRWGWCQRSETGCRSGRRRGARIRLPGPEHRRGQTMPGRCWRRQGTGGTRANVVAVAVVFDVVAAAAAVVVVVVFVVRGGGGGVASAGPG